MSEASISEILVFEWESVVRERAHLQMRGWRDHLQRTLRQQERLESRQQGAQVLWADGRGSRGDNVMLLGCKLRTELRVNAGKRD
eukprot:SAG31_NODE_5517_length_2482_cov_3.611414_3_plen_85_part_00